MKKFYEAPTSQLLYMTTADIITTSPDMAGDNIEVPEEGVDFT